MCTATTTSSCRISKSWPKTVPFSPVLIAPHRFVPLHAAASGGLYPHAHGAVTNNIALHEGTQTLPELLRREGEYASVYCGKWHLGDELYAQHGFDEWYASEDGYQQFFSDTKDKSIKSPFYQQLVDRGYLPDQDDPFIRHWSMKLPERDSKPAYIVDHALDFLQRHEDDNWVASVNTRTTSSCHGPAH